MRTNTKLKQILESHTVGLSFSEGWEMTLINLKTRERRQYIGKTFSEMVTKAYSEFSRGRKKR